MRIIEVIRDNCRITLFTFSVSLGIRRDQFTPFVLEYYTEQINDKKSEGFVINRMHTFSTNTNKKQKSNYGKRVTFKNQMS